LVLEHGDVAHRDCGVCQEFIFDESGRMKIDERNGQPVKRPRGNMALCRYPGCKCPKGTPEAKRSFTEQNEQAYAHYCECRATGQWPDPPDDVVTHHAGLIRRIEDQFERNGREKLSRLMEASLSVPRL
jgi:hypothetical protein